MVSCNYSDSQKMKPGVLSSILTGGSILSQGFYRINNCVHILMIYVHVVDVNMSWWQMSSQKGCLKIKEQFETKTYTNARLRTPNATNHRQYIIFLNVDYSYAKPAQLNMTQAFLCTNNKNHENSWHWKLTFKILGNEIYVRSEV